MFTDSYMPKLIDIIGWQNSTDEKTKTYYNKFGFRQLIVPSDCPNLTERFETLCDLAEARYAFREINRETMEQWQIALQYRFDEIAHTFEHSYALQKKWQSTIDESLTKATENIHNELKEDSVSTTGSDTRTESRSGTDKRTTVDTPDSVVNETLQYADSIEKTTSSNEGTSSGSSTGTSKGTSSGTAEDILADYRNLQDEMDKIMDGYRDLDILFVSKFENNFINIFY